MHAFAAGPATAKIRNAVGEHLPFVNEDILNTAFLTELPWWLIVDVAALLLAVNTT